MKSLHLKHVTNSCCFHFASVDVWKLDVRDAGLHRASFHRYTQGNHAHTCRHVRTVWTVSALTEAPKEGLESLK